MTTSSCFARGLTNTASSVAVTLRKRGKRPKKGQAEAKISEPTTCVNTMRALTKPLFVRGTTAWLPKSISAWACKICGVKTPKKLRGQQVPNAPEIGHIVAIADGGDHVIENCQCECRACNATKGTKAQGQMWLLGFADTKGGAG